MRTHRATILALALAVIHISLAITFASFTPFLEPGFTNGQLLPDIGAPDEYSHIAYVDYVHTYRSIPVLRPGTDSAKTLYEAHQPPLFYALDAAWFSLFGSEVREGPSIAVRSLNAVIGGGTVLGVYFFVLWGFGRRSTALFSASIVAFLPMLCALDGATSNDPLVILLSTWTLALLVRWKDDWTLGRSTLLGVLVGLAILSKASGLLLIPPVLVAVALSESNRWRHAVGALIPIIALSAPWFIRNMQVYGDPLAMSAFYSVFPRGVWPSKVFSGFRAFFRWLYVLAFGTALSSVGIFGYMDIHLRYRFYVPILVLMVAGLVATVWSSRGSNSSEVPNLGRATLPIGLFALLVVASYISYNLWQVQPQARYLFPLIAPLSAWVIIGLQRIWPKRAWLLPSVLCLWLAGADYSAISVLPGEFQKRVEAAMDLGATKPL